MVQADGVRVSHFKVFLRKEILHFVLKYLLQFFPVLNDWGKSLASLPVFGSRNKQYSGELL